MAPRNLLPEPDEAHLRALALVAVEAARAAGVTFADIRLAAARYYGLNFHYDRAGAGSPAMRRPEFGFAVDYGVRALAGGGWGFANGATLTAEAVADTVRAAVEAARGTRPRHRRTFELAPAPSVTDGRWVTPIERDPLTVPLGEQRELALAALAEATKVPGVSKAGVGFAWRCPTVVFASTEGTLLVQRITHAQSSAVVEANVGPGLVNAAQVAVDIPSGGYGYEVVRPATLKAELSQAAEHAAARARVSRRMTSVAVGRYDLVLGAGAVANLLGATVAEALNGERALGYRAHEEGTSFAAPPGGMVGQYQVASKLVTVRADRSQEHGAASAGWDDEGVKPDDYTIVQDGLVVDYHTSRETAAELADLYHERGEAVHSHGCVRRTGRRWPAVYVPNLTLAPGAGGTTVEDLIADTKRGFYLESIGSGRPDQQVLSSQYSVPPLAARQIINGKLGDYVQDLAVQFQTPQFWRSLDALGGSTATQAVTVVTDVEALFDPTQPFPTSTVRAVPARVRQVNVLNTGRAQ